MKYLFLICLLYVFQLHSMFHNVFEVDDIAVYILRLVDRQENYSLECFCKTVKTCRLVDKSLKKCIDSSELTKKAIYALNSRTGWSRGRIAMNLPGPGAQQYYTVNSGVMKSMKAGTFSINDLEKIRQNPYFDLHYTQGCTFDHTQHGSLHISEVLYTLVAVRNPTLFKKLLAYKAPVYLNTLWVDIAQEYSYDMVSLLIEAGIKCHQTVEGYLLLHKTVRNTIEVFSWWQEFKEKHWQAVNKYEKPYEIYKESIRLLIHSKADPWQKDRDQKTAFEHAGKNSVILALLHGAQQKD